MCYNFAGRYDADIEAQLRVTQNLSKPLNEAYNKYDSIGYREHTAAEEKQAEKEYERCKAEYEKEKEGLDRLYELERLARKYQRSDPHILRQNYFRLFIKSVWGNNLKILQRRTSMPI